jgi:hypothetical protein
VRRLVPVPSACADSLKRNKETGIGYQVVSVELKDGRYFDQVVCSEGCIIQVRGNAEIPFSPDEVAIVRVNHKRWNFRDGSDKAHKLRDEKGGIQESRVPLGFHDGRDTRGQKK